MWSLKTRFCILLTTVANPLSKEGSKLIWADMKLFSSKHDNQKMKTISRISRTGTPD